MSLFGLGLFVFAIVAASGPGRIDIVDGQTRFEVGRSLVEHGDSALRDRRIWWASFPGRDSLDFTYYRFPQSLAAAGAILVADSTGPVNEGRRHFLFVWTSAAAAAVLAVVYALFFRRLGYQTGFAVLWAMGGIFCTPNWYYGTSTFDDILGSTTVVAASLAAILARERRPILGAIASGLLLGLAFNVKQPLGAFLPVVLAMHDNPRWTKGRRLTHAGIICLGLLAGIGAAYAYDDAKFPFNKRVVHADLLAIYAPIYAFHPWTALVCFAASPACGILWYCPPAALGLCGVSYLWRRGQRTLMGAVLLSSAVFIGFHCFVSFFKGDPAWGPRYLTPWFALIWLFAPLGASLLRRQLVGLLLGSGVLVQLLGLAVDPHRLFVARNMTGGEGLNNPWCYFTPEYAHILQRPREIVEILRDSGRAEAFTPSPAPTFAFPVLVRSDDLPKTGRAAEILPLCLTQTGSAAVNRYQVLRSFRPWWASQQYLPAEQRPINFPTTLAMLAAAGATGVILMISTVRFRAESTPNCR